jgi:predicted MFS family arabinose efflux permease
MTGIVALSLPFAYDYSPIEAVFKKGQWPFALPFFLSILASAASIRWIISGSFSRPEQIIAYALSTAMAGVTMSLYVNSYGWPSNIQEWLSMIIPISILLFGVYAIIRNVGVGRYKKFSPIMALQVAYLANAVLCLIEFFGKWQAGAYCVLVVAVVFLLQIILIQTDK